MNRSVVLAGLEKAILLAVAGLCLFGACAGVKSGWGAGPILGEILAALHDSATQWMVFVCGGMYFAGFGILRRRLAGGDGVGECGGLRVESRAGSGRDGWGLAAQCAEEPAFWLAGLMVLAAVAYGLDYAEAVKPAQALTLVGAAMVGQGVAFFQSRKQKAESRCARRRRA